MEVTNKDLLRDSSYINASWVSSDHKFDVINPANGAKIAGVSEASANQVHDALNAAYEAFSAWAAVTAKERSAFLRNWFGLIMKNQEDLARIMTAEQGKPLAESRGEVAYGASFIEWFAEEGKRTYGDIIPSYAVDRRIVVLKQPVGVIAAITPWNFPIAMIARKVAPALAAGCTAVVKPSEETPLSALAIASLAGEAGIPPGVLNVITSTKAEEVGDIITSSPKVRKISFTGSTRVGKILMSKSAQTVKKVSLELGGNAPFIVFDDADIEAAIEGAIQSKYRNAGQTCICANRFLVQDEIYDQFVERLGAKMKALKVGHGNQEGVDIGPLINSSAIEKVERIIEEAVSKGAKVFSGGKRSSQGALFYEPTILTDVNREMGLHHEEIFGPVAPVFRFRSEEEAIEMANDTSAGLAAYFYTQDSARSWRISERLEYGMVGVNTGLISTEVAPFGGVKESGIGREGSKYGIEEYMEIKYVNFQIS